MISSIRGIGFSASYRSPSANDNQVTRGGKWIHVFPSVASFDREGSTTPITCGAFAAIVAVMKIDTRPQIMDPDGETSIAGRSSKDVVAGVLDYQANVLLSCKLYCLGDQVGGCCVHGIPWRCPN